MRSRPPWAFSRYSLAHGTVHLDAPELAGVKSGLFEHHVEVFSCGPHLFTLETLAYQHDLAAAC